MFKVLKSILKQRYYSKDDMDAGLANNSIVGLTRHFGFVEPIIKKPKGRKISQATSETHYRNDHECAGVALIFNQINVPRHSPRTGTEKDKERVELILRAYGFDVRSYDDLTYTRIAEIITEVSNDDHSNNDCLLVIVLTHGSKGYIWSADEEYLVENLWVPFSGENCPTLIDKPKLFFIQACRGDKGDAGANYVSEGINLIPKSGNFDEIDGAKSHTIPSTADIMLYYATFDGYVSFRNRDYGSWFIQSVSLTLEEYRKNLMEFDIYHFITTVNRKVAYEYQSDMPGRYNEMKAMPNIMSTLTKIFIMKPK